MLLPTSLPDSKRTNGMFLFTRCAIVAIPTGPAPITATGKFDLLFIFFCLNILLITRTGSKKDAKKKDEPERFVFSRLMCAAYCLTQEVYSQQLVSSVSSQ